MEWNEHLRSILRENTVLDTLSFDLVEEHHSMAVPPVIKASILMLDRITAAQGNRNIFAFPERTQSAFMFALIKSIYNIAQGETEKTYSPYKFKKGQKLKFQNCVMEFDRIDEVNGRNNIFVKFTDMTYGLPMELAPHMQLTETNLLSHSSSFNKVFSVRETLTENSSGRDLLKVLQDHKTHLNSSVFYVSPVMKAKEQLTSCKINGKYISDILFLGHANPDGKIGNLAAGQLAGKPAMVIAADVSSVLNAYNKGATIQTVIIDISNSNMIDSQLSFIDELLRLDCPTICVTDIVNSFELQPLLTRDFNLWRWDEHSITWDLYGNSRALIDIKTEYCANRKIDFINLPCPEISNSLKLLHIHRNEVSEQSARMITVFEKLFSLVFTVLRANIPICADTQAQVQAQLSDCEYELSAEKKYISDSAYIDYQQIITNLKEVNQCSYSIPKNLALAQYLTDNAPGCVCIVVPERTDKHQCREYWNKYCRHKGLITVIFVMYPAEYWNQRAGSFDLVIIVGWFNNNNMKRILYSFNAEKYLVLLYDIENQWMTRHMNIWSQVLNNESNKIIIRKSFDISSEPSVPQFRRSPDEEPVHQEEELEEIELILRENKYRRYMAGSGERSAEETVEAVPVNFVGGYLSFFKISHKVVTATEIIMNNGEKTKEKLPSELQVGDFIIVRESDRDIIREIADAMLSNSGKSDYRDLATKWKESLEIERIFSSDEDIYKKLEQAGCAKDFSTFLSWLTNDNIIAPMQKEDLIHIAMATEDSVLLELVDKVYDAAREVKNAHIQAGKYLSNRLKKTIAEILKSYGDIDPFNIWEPISLPLEDTGTVNILKIIDIGSRVMVDAAYANRLIEEM